MLISERRTTKRNDGTHSLLRPPEDAAAAASEQEDIFAKERHDTKRTEEISATLCDCESASQSDDWTFLASRLDDLDVQLRDEGFCQQAGKGKAVDTSTRYCVASKLLHLAVGDATIQSRWHRCLDLCGSFATFSAATNTLQSIDSGHFVGDSKRETKAVATTVADAVSINNSVRILRRILLSIRHGAEDSDGDATARILPLQELCREYYTASLSTALSDKENCNAKVKTVAENAMSDLSRRSILLPVCIASACHRANLNLPPWATRDRYCKRIVEVALEVAIAEELENTDSTFPLVRIFLRKLLEKMIQHGAADAAVLGLFKVWDRNRECNTNCEELDSFPSILSATIQNVASAFESPRNSATLLRSMIRLVASKLGNEDIRLLRKRSGGKEQKSIWSLPLMAFLNDACVVVLESSDSIHRDAFFRAVVLSPSPPMADSNGGEREYRWLVIPCIAAYIIFALSTQREDDSAFFQCLIEASEIWNMAKTDELQQVYVTEFIEASIPFLDKSNEGTEEYQHIFLALIQGVTSRLESSKVTTRRQGMLVAEMVAPLLGQTLRFEELDEVRHEKNLDCGKGDQTIQANANHSDEEDSVWSEDLVPYDLHDDEEDLSTVKRPRYLRDCLALLRTSDDNEKAYDSIEVAMKYLSAIVKTVPPDLPDLAVPLAKELLYSEDKYNMPNFSTDRLDALSALIVNEPASVGRFLVESMFANISFGTRVEILCLIERGADDLCGAAELRDDRKLMSNALLLLQDRVSGKRRIVHDAAEQKGKAATGAACKEGVIETPGPKTRRWGRGRKRSSRKSVANHFGQIAPMWFYSLVSQFFKAKDDPSIFGGTNGAKFFSSFLVTLSKIVGSSGHHPQTPIIAADLFQLAWPFRDAESTEIRMAVLVAIASCCSFLPADFVATRYENENLASYLQLTATRDPDSTCREIAVVIAKSIESNMRLEA